MLGHFLFQTSRRMVSLVLIIALAFSPSFSYAQSAFVATLPAPGTMVGTSDAFVPVLVKGLVVHPDKPLNFDFIVDSGNDSADQSVVKEQSQRMAQYFLAAITVPEEQLWVNLSPYEKDRVIENELGQTVLGRDMLAQDYILKQVTSSLIYPEKGLGKEFWARVYAEAQAKFGTTDIPVDTFNKVWIMPEKAEVFEKGNAVYVTDAKLKVMLDSDRTAMSQNASDAMTDEKAAVAKAMMREIVLPAIEKEVNEGKNFAAIRQVYHAAILAKWYRELIQNTLLSEAYVGKNKVAGVTTDEKALKEEIYQRYIAAYKKGVFNYIKEEATASGETLPRKYFSGGIEDFAMKNVPLARTTDAAAVSHSVGKVFQVDMAMGKPEDATMTGGKNLYGRVMAAIEQNISAYVRDYFGMEKIRVFAEQVVNHVINDGVRSGSYILTERDDSHGDTVFHNLRFAILENGDLGSVNIAYSFMEIGSPSSEGGRDIADIQFLFSSPDAQIKKNGDAGRTMAELNTIAGLSDLFHGPGDAINNTLRQTVVQLKEEMVKARKGEKTSLKMLKSFLKLDSKRDAKEGEFIALDFGGSTVRVALVRISPAGEASVVKQNDSKLTNEHRTGTKDFLFNMIANEVKKLVAEIGADSSKAYPLVFTFAHPVNQTSLSEATLQAWSKEVTVPGVVGENVVKILQESLVSNGVRNVNVVAILNDIVATHAASPNASAALILGTGYNVSVLDEKTREVINVHPSAFANIPNELLTKYDESFLERNKSKFSNLISGRKIAELIRIISMDYIKNENLRNRLSAEDSFSIRASSQLEGTSSIEEARQVLVMQLGLAEADIHEDDLRGIMKVNKVITQRAGYMVAVSLTASLQMIDPNIEKEHVIVVDGSVFQKHPTLRKYIEGGLIKILGESRAGQIKFEFIKDAFVLGAARTAALVSTKSEAVEDLDAGFWAEEAADQSREDTLSAYRRNSGKDSAQVNEKSKEMQFLAVVQRNDKNGVKQLLSQGVDVNTRDVLGRTALIIASGRGEYNYTDMVRFLLEHGANVNAQDDNGNSALMVANESSTAITNLLLQKGANVNLRNKYGTTALMKAARFGPSSRVQKFIAAGADVSAVDNEGNTALSEAKRGAETGPDWFEMQPKNTVFSADDIEIIKILKDAGAKDKAMLQTPENGGIDIQNIDVAHKNGSARIQFNDQAVRDVLKNGFNGFTPVIINITPVQSPLMILGVNQVEATATHT